MKALSIKEPWASMIYAGLKTIEIRTWNTNYRGKILLCASQKPKSWLSGLAFATANLVECRIMIYSDRNYAKCEYNDKGYAWILEDIAAIRMFPVKGHLGLFDVDYKEE